MKYLRKTVLTSIAAIAALAAGCSTADDAEPPPTSEVASSAESSPDAVTETVTEKASGGDDAAGKDSAEAPENGRDNGGAPDENCAALPTDPREQYPDGSAPGRMPQAGPNPSGTQYWIENVENNYDPCAPISWIVFRGTLGDENKQGGTASSIVDGAAFYIDGIPVSGMKIVTAVEGVKKLDERTVEFSWGERGGATVEGITDHYSVTLESRGGVLEPVSGDTKPFLAMWNETPENEYVLGHGEEN